MPSFVSDQGHYEDADCEHCRGANQGDGRPIDRRARGPAGNGWVVAQRHDSFIVSSELRRVLDEPAAYRLRGVSPPACNETLDGTRIALDHDRR